MILSTGNHFKRKKKCVDDSQKKIERKSVNIETPTLASDSFMEKMEFEMKFFSQFQGSIQIQSKYYLIHPMTDHLNWNQLQIKCSQLTFQKGKSFLVSNFNRWRNLPRSSQQSNGQFNNMNIRIFAVVNCKISSQRSAANPMYSQWWTDLKV